MKEQKNIEDLFKEAFDHYEVDPGDQLWSKIQQDLPGNPASASGNAVSSSGSIAAKTGAGWLTTAIVGGSIAIISVAGYFYFENKAGNLKKEKQEKTQIQPESSNPDNSPKPEETLGNTENANIDDATITKEANSDLVEEQSPEKATNEKTQKAKGQIRLDEKPSKATASKQKKTELTRSDKQTEESENNFEVESNEQVSTEAPIRQQQSSKVKADNSITEENSAEESASINQKTESTQKSGTDQTVTENGQLSEEQEKADDLIAEKIKNYKAPNAFSPNGDGTNDIFQIEIKDLEVDKLEVSIFNKSGAMINQWKGIYGFWDGKTRSGNLAPEGTYFYRLLITKDGKLYPKQGSITLLRDK